MLCDLLFAAASTVGREVTVQEPVMTWNLFLTAFLVPTCSALTVAVLVAYINWKHKKRDKRDEENDRLRRELEEEKMRNTIQWRQQHSDLLCRVKDKVENIYNGLDKKVDKDDCKTMMEMQR